ncbi:MAG: hypothetical protein CBD74_08265 [Saprospirales bacterium TMED214]|nr:MAG: hypothetical protein CBD74_08265 [Saprospirales bacterium TMED214]
MGNLFRLQWLRCLACQTIGPRMIAKGKFATLGSQNGDLATDHVVSRLRQRLRDARATGFKVRMEVLDDEQASWCVISGVLTLFVDLSQTASEQLQQVEETLSAYEGCSGRQLNHAQDLGKRAA